MLNSPTYGLFMLLALIVFVVSRHFQEKPEAIKKLHWMDRLILGLAALVGGAFGAKIPFVIAGDQNWWVPQAWLSDGKTITTGLLGAYVGVEIAKWILKIRARTGDTFAIPLALALAIGRWGCFFHGCCYGAATSLPWGVNFGDGVLRHPTQLYEVLFHFSMGMFCWWLIRRGYLKTHRLKLYLICYGIYRFATEYLRPEPRDYVGLTLYQWIAIVLIVSLSLQWFYHAWQAQPKGAAQSQFA